MCLPIDHLPETLLSPFEVSVKSGLAQPVPSDEPVPCDSNLKTEGQPVQEDQAKNQ